MADDDAFMNDLLADLGTQTGVPLTKSTRFNTSTSRSRVKRQPLIKPTTSTRSIASTSESNARPAPFTSAPKQTRPVQSLDADDFGDDAAWAQLVDKYDAMVGKTKPLPTPVLQQEQLTRCIVDSISEEFAPNKRFQKVVIAKVEVTDEVVEIVLTDDWSTSQLSKGMNSSKYFSSHADYGSGDVLHVIGEFTSSKPRSIQLSVANGLLIQHPDVLLTATHVSNSHKCVRKPILGQLLPGAGPDASAAVTWGNMLHEVLQACFVAQRFDQTFIDLRIEDAINSSLDALTRLDVSAAFARAELNKRSAGLQAFAKRYVASTPQVNAIRTALASGAVVDLGLAKNEQALVALTRVNAIEEDIWSPRYGLKGKVDASMQTSVTEDGKTTEWTQPFEIKTGRSIAGLEHRAQTMLYTLLTAERYGVEVPSGLLYYTQGSDLIRVPARRNEVRGLILLRNEMASHIAGRWRDGFDPTKASTDFLPAPIDEDFACSKCFNVDACTLYRKAVEKKPVTDASSPVAGLWREKTGHLTDAHCEFFAQWERLIALEESEMTRFRRELWTMNARERELHGRAFSDLALAPRGSTENPRQYTFVRKHMPGRTKDSLLSGHISQGDAVVLTIDPHVIAFSRGFVVDLQPDRVVISVDQPLQLQGTLLSSRGLQQSDLVFRLDKDELAGGISRIRDNLARLFYAKGDDRRRELIVDLTPPRFIADTEDQAFVSAQKTDTSVALNAHQEAALLKVISAQDYALILGMPGTGKTTLTAELIRHLVSQGKSVLLTSYTHSAVDTIIRAVGAVEFDILRLGNAEKVHPDVRKYTVGAREPARTIGQYEDLILRPPVVATTCLTIDQYEGFDVSLFSRLCNAHPAAVADLAIQYRMNADIMALSNELVYGGRLQCGSDAVAQQRLKLLWPAKASCQRMQCLRSGCWLERVVEEQTKVLFLNTDALSARETKAGDLVHNELEIKLIEQIVDALLARGVFEDDIGVISLYRQQLKALQHTLAGHPKLEVLTADRSQGRDKPCVLVSMVRSNEEQHTGELLKDWRRINVALTRAKQKLVVIGSRQTLSKVDTLSKFFDLCDRRGWTLDLPAEAHLVHRLSRLEVAATAPRSAKRPAPDIETEKENTSTLLPSKKRAKTATLTPEAFLHSRPLLRDVVNGH
ncbi:Dna2-domain-containing protein [Auriculariales sp. MPI-PUGE-AT-0066]|nr:Dna2-domain-containing protein [Auriculariales sp. MPI-PUGE-AT-0066]